MTNNLSTKRQNTTTVLSKTKNLMGITNSILSSRSSLLANVLDYKPFIVYGHSSTVASVAYSPDGKT